MTSKNYGRELVGVAGGCTWHGMTWPCAMRHGRAGERRGRARSCGQGRAAACSSAVHSVARPYLSFVWLLFHWKFCKDLSTWMTSAKLLGFFLGPLRGLNNFFNFYWVEPIYFPPFVIQITFNFYKTLRNIIHML